MCPFFDSVQFSLFFILFCFPYFFYCSFLQQFFFSRVPIPFFFVCVCSREENKQNLIIVEHIFHLFSAFFLLVILCLVFLFSCSYSFYFSVSSREENKQNLIIIEHVFHLLAAFFLLVMLCLVFLFLCSFFHFFFRFLLLKRRK